MYQQTLASVTNPHPLTLGVDQDLQGHIQISRRVYIDMTVAIKVLDHWHRGFFHNTFDQTSAAARNGDVDILRELQEVSHCGSVGRIHQLNGSVGQTTLGRRARKQRYQCLG